ncbi:type I methionyl aminopeptidase [Candidatus Woesebacteria bacterium]|nr:type I methionyl aminopeptidase [Candidatus Woesebacteria bacterium]
MNDADKKRISAMREGGSRLGKVKRALVDFTKVGTRFEEIEAEAVRLIHSFGARPNFSLVPGYSWATCIMKNAELCHGIPKGKVVEEGDVITIDVGLLYNDYNLDTTTTFSVGAITTETNQFIQRGKQVLDEAIAAAVIGNTVYDISLALERGLQRYSYGVVYQLTGHGIGTQLHMEPSIPVFADKSSKKHKLTVGQTLAIEVMYTQGLPELKIASDGWTFRTKDGSLGGMFEETVLITSEFPEVLTV